MARRLTDKHPLYQKLEKVFDLMNDLGVTLDVDRYGRCHIEDRETKLSVLLMDNEAPVNAEYGNISQFPPTFEYKMIVEE